MNIKSVGLAVVAGMMVVGCGKQASEEGQAEDVMAVSVNGEKLMKSAIDADVAVIVKAQGNKIPADRLDEAKRMMGNQIVEKFIVEKALLAKAMADGFAITDADRKAREAEFLKATAKMPDAPKSIEDYFKTNPFGEARARSEFENGILIDKMIKAEQAKAPKKDYTAKARERISNIASNNVPEKMVKASHILIKTDADEKAALKKIKELKAQLDKVPAKDVEAKFAELAKANSACPSSAKGGNLGEFGPGQMVKEFDAAAFKLPVGKVSDPVKTQFGYHLLLVTKKLTPAEIKELNAKKIPSLETVAKRLQADDERAFIQSFVMTQIRAAKIEASEEYKQFLPPAEKPAAAPAKAPAEAPVEKSAQK